jgi:hypothetical protein
MTLEQFLSLIATIFGAVGSIYVLRSILKLTPKITERMSATVFGHNPEIIDSLSTQKAESVVGTWLILIALIIAVINSAATPSNIVVNSNRILAILFGVIISAIIYGVLLFFGSKVNSRHRLETARIIAAKTLDRLFQGKKVPLYEIKSLHYLNERFLGIQLPSGLSNKDFLHLVAKDVSCIMPDDLQVEEESSK